MNICVPSDSNHGKKSRLFDHFGSAPYFTIYNQDTDELDIVSNRNEHHEHDQCNPISIISAHKVKAIICPGMGRRAVMALENAGIQIYLAQSATVEECLREFSENKLRVITPEEACAGRGHSRR
jgi:predicted Fe-Mo cluster-binding NifX family protein